MMRLHMLLVLATIALAPVASHAQSHLDDGQRRDMKKHLQNVTPEQRDALTSQGKDKWDNLTPAQRKTLESKARARFDHLTPAQEHALKERFKGHHN